MGLQNLQQRQDTSKAVVQSIHLSALSNVVFTLIATLIRYSSLWTLHYGWQPVIRPPLFSKNSKANKLKMGSFIANGISMSCTNPHIMIGRLNQTTNVTQS